MQPAALTLAGTLALVAPFAPHLPPGDLNPPLAPLLPAWAGAHPRFGWSGAWIFPVGNPYTIGLPGPDGSPAYRVNRCIGGPDEGGRRHEGADLSCGRGGQLVRAAAHGMVVKAETAGWNGGYGRTVVIAHRLAAGGIAYSVYAHLADSSIRVRAGQLVAAGQPIARVGRTGRASSSHLHFEVRYTEAFASEPWQKAEVLDPITFVSEHLPARPKDATATAPYVEWADCAAMLLEGNRADEVLERATWWRMMARAVRQPGDDLPDEADSWRRVLIATGVLAGAPPDSELTWGEMARDLKRLRRAGVMVPRPPISPDAHRAECGRRLGAPRPSLALDLIGKRKGAPLLGVACLALADLAGSWDPPQKEVKKAEPAPAAQPPAAHGPAPRPVAKKPAATPPRVAGRGEVDGRPR